MRKAILIAVAVASLFVFANRPLAAADITVSPNIINIASASTVVTVHTELFFCLTGQFRDTRMSPEQGAGGGRWCKDTSPQRATFSLLAVATKYAKKN